MGLFSSLASKLVGGVLDRKSNNDARKAAQSYQHPKRIRKRYEAAGFNPLLAFQGNGAGTIAPQVGQSHAFSNLISSTLDEHREQKYAKAQLEQENQRLEMMAQELTLKEKGMQVATAGAVGASARNSANREQGNVNDVDERASPLTFGDDNPYYETVMGVKMPYEAGDRNTAAGGDVMGEGQNYFEWAGRGFDQINEYLAKRSGHYVFRSGGKIYKMKKKHRRVEPQTRKPPWLYEPPVSP